ncbi:hypothetical protein [Nitrospirillum iridis]|uniref:Uncharacterized protein n=1 Tax=Nitrospirillum iridis TaxID=765888 RepID=A0A7X0B0W7_9PROT|nr:hypothetical protein [Nitrospirillum iridis]MBB6253625.1 hypothetical protein [Nitrospirillum iridis]
MNDSVRMAAGMAPVDAPAGSPMGISPRGAPPAGSSADQGAEQGADDVPVFGWVSLVMVFCGSELAVYGATTLAMPLLDLKAGAFLLAWGVSLVLMGPLLGLLALYIVLRLRLAPQGAETVSAIAPRTAVPLTTAPGGMPPHANGPKTGPVPARAASVPPPPAFQAPSGQPARHPG